jgi:hypothetical protein
MNNNRIKLNRLAMHEEWFNRNEKIIFLEARAVMRELLAMAKERTKERDESRIECCMTWEAVLGRKAQTVAADKGWDCFNKENTK